MIPQSLPRVSPLGLHAGAVFAFLYLPIVTIAVLSFHDSTVFALPWQGFTTRWYQRAIANPDLLVAFRNSLLLGCGVGATAMMLGTALALAFRMPFRGKPLVLGLILLPVMTPPIVHGVALAMFWRLNDLPLSLYSSAFVGHLTFVMPFVFLTIFPRAHRFDRALEEAAMDLGARPLKVFFVITLPIIFPAILSGWLLAFTLSWDDLVISSFTSGPGSSTLPMVVFSKVRLGVSPEINVLATITITVVTLMIVGVSLWMSRIAKLDKAAA